MSEWKEYNREDKAKTAPREDELVWVYEEFYENGVTIGLFDGFTFLVMPSGSDDCSVTHWMPMTKPEAPSGG